ncbi:hypothetical protein ACJJTC_009120 [Scirpophaga incertulas]
MGCINSKNESPDVHPSIFRVMNIDENGVQLCSGRLEITDEDIILHREGRDSTVWPLHSLRRYGFEGEIFSFESGRRCDTGEGIYAFKCKRASLLFHTLQQKIQQRNALHDAAQNAISRLSPPPQSRQTLQASVIHRSSVDNGRPEARTVINSNIPNISSSIGLPRPVSQSSRSPSSADILEVMPLYPRPQTNGHHVTNIYQVRDFKKEHNNNQSSNTVHDSSHVYSNDINRDLAILRNSLRQETALNNMRDLEDEHLFLERKYASEISSKNKAVKTILSPTLSTNSEHYAQLSIEQQESARLYVNVVPNEKFQPDKQSDITKCESVPSTPLTPKQVEYSNLCIGIELKPEINTYANLTLGEIGDSVRNVKQVLQTIEHTHKYSESDTFTSMSPVEEMEINYAVLDIDSSKETIKNARELISPESQSFNSSRNESTASCSSQPRRRLISQNSSEKTSATGVSVTPLASIGYTTIDFDKTVALTSVAAGNEIDNMDTARKTRHNSCNVLLTASPNVN